MKPDETENITSRIKLQAIHFELTDAMKDILHEKFEGLLQRNDYIIRINVRLQQAQTLGTEHHYTATAQIEIGGPDLIASADGKDAYAVIDEVVDKLDRLLERRQGRRKDRRNHPAPTEIDADLPKVE